MDSKPQDAAYWQQQFQEMQDENKSLKTELAAKVAAAQALVDKGLSLAQASVAMSQGACASTATAAPGPTAHEAAAHESLLKCMRGLLTSCAEDDDMDSRVRKSHDAMVNALCQAVAREAGEGLGRMLDPDCLESCRFSDGGATLFRLLAEVQRQRGREVEHAKRVAVKSKSAAEFCFSDDGDFKGGLQKVIGMPSGLDAKQWESAMRREHCDVDAGRDDSELWGASDRGWVTGNYKLATTPRAEYLWVAEQRWEGKQVEWAPGAFLRGSAGVDSKLCEDATLRRRAVSIDVLCRDAPALFLACMDPGVHHMTLASARLASAWLPVCV